MACTLYVHICTVPMIDLRIIQSIQDTNPHFTQNNLLPTFGTAQLQSNIQTCVDRMKDASVLTQNLMIKLQQDLINCHTIFARFGTHPECMWDVFRTCSGCIWDA